MRILVAEDDPNLCSLLVQGLTEHGYITDYVLRGDEALDKTQIYDYDVAVIDWRMPGLPGIDVVRHLRNDHKAIGIILLTARDTPEDRIEGLDAGADDYLVKPFNFGELLARVRALQRRPRVFEGTTLTCGNLVLDPVLHAASIQGNTVNLTSTEYNILELLMRRSPAVVNRKAIAQHAWHDETDPLGSNAIDVQMSRLRGKIPNAHIKIVTVRGVGYRLEEG